MKLHWKVIFFLYGYMFTFVGALCLMKSPRPLLCLCTAVLGLIFLGLTVFVEVKE